MLNCCRALLTALPQTTAETYQTCSSLRGPSPENFSNYLPDEAALPCCIRSVRAKFQHPRAKTVAAKGHKNFCWLTDWQSDPQSCWSQLKSFYFMKHVKRWRKVTKDKLATASCHHAEWALLLLHWTFSLLTFNTRSILNFKFEKCSSDQPISLLIKQLWHASLLTAHILISQDLDLDLIKPTICVLTCAWICTIRVCWGHASWLQSSVQTLFMVILQKRKDHFSLCLSWQVYSAQGLEWTVALTMSDLLLVITLHLLISAIDLSHSTHLTHRSGKRTGERHFCWRWFPSTNQQTRRVSHTSTLQPVHLQSKRWF